MSTHNNRQIFTHDKFGRLKNIAEIPWHERKNAPSLFSALIVNDTIDALCHPVTGKMMTSRSAFRATTKENGYVEFGDAPISDVVSKPSAFEEKTRRENSRLKIAEIYESMRN